MTTPSLVASANGLNNGFPSFTVNKPTGTLNGHVMLMIVCQDDSLNATSTGWDVVQSAGGYTVLKKVAGASEPSSYTIDTPNEPNARAIICTFQDADSVDFPHKSAKASSTANAPSVTTTTDDCLLILIGMSLAANFTTQPADTDSIATLNSGGPSLGINVASKAQSAAGASGTNAFGASRSFTATVAIASVSAPVSSDLPLGFGFGSFLGDI